MSTTQDGAACDVGLPTGPVLRALDLLRLSLVAGPHLVKAMLSPLPFGDRWALDGIVTAIYLITDAQGRIRWLGQASREDDLAGRLHDHARHPERIKVFAHVRVLHLADHTPQKAVDAIEGRCADLLGLRGAMGRRRWPTSDSWLAQMR